MESVLVSIKKLLGIHDSYDAYDQDLIIFINSAFMVLNQLGIGPVHPFTISGVKETWNDFLPGIMPLNANGVGTQSIDDFQLVKSYVYLKVRLLFDPPDTGVLHEAMERQITEFEWRLSVQAEGGDWHGKRTESDSSGEKDGLYIPVIIP